LNLVGNNTRSSSSAILAMRPVRHRPQGPCSQGAPNMKADIQYSYSLSMHYACYPTFNAIYRSCVQQKKNTLQALVTSKKNGMASYLRHKGKEEGIMQGSATFPESRCQAKSLTSEISDFTPCTHGQSNILHSKCAGKTDY